jgi:hypothetical protein
MIDRNPSEYGFSREEQARREAPLPQNHPAIRDIGKAVEDAVPTPNNTKLNPLQGVSAGGIVRVNGQAEEYHVDYSETTHTQPQQREVRARVSQGSNIILIETQRGANGQLFSVRSYPHATNPDLHDNFRLEYARRVRGATYTTPQLEPIQTQTFPSDEATLGKVLEMVRVAAAIGSNIAMFGENSGYVLHPANPRQELKPVRSLKYSSFSYPSTYPQYEAPRGRTPQETAAPHEADEHPFRPSPIEQAKQTVRRILKKG